MPSEAYDASFHMESLEQLLDHYKYGGPDKKEVMETVVYWVLRAYEVSGDPPLKDIDNLLGYCHEFVNEHWNQDGI